MDTGRRADDLARYVNYVFSLTIVRAIRLTDIVYCGYSSSLFAPSRRAGACGDHGVPATPPADPSAGSGCVVAAGAHDGIVRTWDVSVDARKGKAKVEGDHRMLVGHEGAVTCVAAGPGGDHFASCGHDKTVRVWNRAGGS